MKKKGYDDLIWYRTRMSRLLRQLSSPASESKKQLVETSDPVVDVWERGDEIIIECELPGVREKEVKLYVDEGYLIIEGQKTESHDAACLRYLRLERQYGFFRRVIELPASVFTADVKATLSDGLLSIKFTKVTERRKVKVRIPVTS
ncbi:MAG: Hsp20/alpha crystallin family protein [bacterium]